MANGINLLSTRKSESAKPGDHYDGGGLILRVSPKLKRVWYYRFRFAKGRYYHKLGTFPGMSLADARAKRDQGNAWLNQGYDPRVMWQREKDAANEVETDDVTTFGPFAMQELERLTAHLTSDKSRKQWYSTIRTYCQPIWHMPLAEIKGKHVGRLVLAPIWKSKHETATKLRGRLEQIFDTAIAYELRDESNPARASLIANFVGKPTRDELRVRHHVAHNFEDMPDFFAKLADRDATSARAFMFKILTAARTSEVREMTWDEIDFDKARWTVPAERMKQGREHIVPLSSDALAVLEAIEGLRTGYVFPSENGKGVMSNGAMLALIRRMGEDGKNRDGERVTPHGCARAGFKTWAVEATEFDNMISEFALAHVEGKLMQAYARASIVEKRRHMMQDWADYLHKRAKGKVVKLRTA
ncbi:MAG: tyrosine-type recombinase/integrase [Pseudomonadota bacterium]